MRRWLGAALLLAAPHSVWAVCTVKQLTAGWLWNYSGTIGQNDGIRLTFTRAQDAVTGVYFHASDMKDIRVSGSISRDQRLDLGDFRLQFVEHDPHGKFPGVLRCQVLSGYWQKLPVYLSLESGRAGTLDHMYAIAGSKDDAVVNRSALRFWQAVKQDDKATVASLIEYPIRVRIGGSMTTIRDAKEMLARYDAVFTGDYRNAIAAELPRNMFANDRGIALGKGEVWFGSTGRVIMLNTGTP